MLLNTESSATQLEESILNKNNDPHKAFKTTMEHVFLAGVTPYGASAKRVEKTTLKY